MVGSAAVRLFPTRSALDVAVAGAAVVLVGILLFRPAVVAWGGALIVALAVARAFTLLEVARVRAAGFEMVWRSGARSLRLARGETAALIAEIRNRDTRAARYVQLRVLASPHLDVAMESGSGEVPAGGRLEVRVDISGRRVGRHGLFGLGLELRGGPGSFEVPLTFSNPFGVEVTPASGLPRRRQAARSGLFSGRATAKKSGDAGEFSEIRDHQFGDSLKRVAWKASARRGKLLTRRHEVEERETAWFVLDASSALWAGRVGSAPLDYALDCVSDLARQHLRSDHEVGLAVLTGGAVSRLDAARGLRQEQRLLQALLAAASTLEPERSDLDEKGVALRVLEHLRALTPLEARGVSPGDLDAIAALASRALPQAPFAGASVHAPAPRESILRTYLAAFGIGGPAKVSARSSSVEHDIAGALLGLSRGRRRASVIHVVAPLPDDERWQIVAGPLRIARRRRVRVQWLHPPELPGLELPSNILGRVARTAARLRSESDRQRAELRLRQVGVSSAACATALALPESSEPASGAEQRASG